MDGSELPTEFSSSRGREKTRRRYSNISDKVWEIVDGDFSKKFSFSCPFDWRMPDPSTLFNHERFVINKLQSYKNELNSVKNELNYFPLKDWHKHTGDMNHAGVVFPTLKRVFKPELFTQAWCKFYEILCSYNVIPKMCTFSGKLNSVHLCEAPGAFITSLNHYLYFNHPCMEWKWRCTTLNPYYEGNTDAQMIGDDRLIMYTFENWSFGADWTGNLFEVNNFEDLLKDTASMGPVYLVTADGSVDCQIDPGEQENIVTGLHYCETIAALNILNQGGSFVLKIFTMFESETICLMYLLCCFFESVNVFKPVTSKEGNSESYIVCLGFIGRDNISEWLSALNKHYGPNITATSMFKKADLPPSFIDELMQCSEFFKNQQVAVIKRNLRTYNNGMYKEEQDEILAVRKAISDEFIKRYRIKQLPQSRFVYPNITKHINLCLIRRDEDGSFKERKYYLEKNKEKEFLLYCKEGLESIRELVYFDESLHMEIEVVSLHSVAKEQFNKVNLNFTKGKRIKELSFSKFCINKIVQTRKKLEVFVTDSTELLPSAMLESFLVNPEDKDMVFDSCDLVDNIWQVDIHENNLSILLRIKDSLHELKEGESLYLTGYGLLTNLSVGILYLLGLCFQNVVFFNPSKYGYQLLLYKYDPQYKYVQSNNIEQVLNNIINTMKECTEDQSLLSIVPIKILCNGEFYKCVTTFNNIMLKESSLNIIKEALKKEK